MIIVEGMDNTGKTTLVNKLAEMGLSKRLLGGPPKDKASLKIQLKDQFNLASHPMVQDRATCISQQVYWDKMSDVVLNGYLHSMIREKHCLVIYCRPPEEVILNFATHERKEYDTDEHIKYVTDNAKRFVQSYDLLMSNIPHLVYDYTNPTLDLELVVKSQFDKDTWYALLSNAKDS